MFLLAGARVPGCALRNCTRDLLSLSPLVLSVSRVTKPTSQEAPSLLYWRSTTRLCKVPPVRLAAISSVTWVGLP